jgi:hypothetical protein
VAATVSINGTDVSGVAIKGSVTRRLNRPSQAQITIPMDAAIGGPGSRLKVGFPGLLFHGFILDCETDTGEDTGYTVYNATDPMELWNWRPARDPDGDFSNPTFIEDNVTGPQIMEAILDASENAGLGPPADAEGPLFLSMGGFAGGGVSLVGAPTDWPMTIAEIASLLISSGQLDVVLTAIDSGGNMAQVDCYNGNYGTDLSGSVSFEYATGDLNVRRLRWNEDMTSVVNKMWYYGGPRVGTPRDPAGEQHWCWNITGDDCCFTGIDGPFCTCVSPDAGAMQTAFSTVDSCRDSSQSAVGVRMQIQIFDSLGEDCIGKTGLDPGRDLFRWMWLAESYARCTPRDLVHITPTRGTAIGSFDIGDIVAVSAGSSVRGGFSGAQRVYQYTISWDEDGPFELSELQTSSDVGIGS